MLSVLEEHRTRIAKLRDRCKEQLEKKIEEPELRNVMSLLQKGISWLTRQQSEFIDHLKLTLEDQVNLCEAQYKSETAPGIAALYQVCCILTRP